MAATSTETCLHHWVIEPPNGTFSRGRCKRCGVDREFRNSSEDQQWDRDNFSLRGNGANRGKKRAS